MWLYQSLEFGDFISFLILTKTVFILLKVRIALLPILNEKVLFIKKIFFHWRKCQFAENNQRSKGIKVNFSRRDKMKNGNRKNFRINCSRLTDTLVSPNGWQISHRRYCSFLHFAAIETRCRETFLSLTADGAETTVFALRRVWFTTREPKF